MIYRAVRFAALLIRDFFWIIGQFAIAALGIIWGLLTGALWRD